VSSTRDSSAPNGSGDSPDRDAIIESLRRENAKYRKDDKRLAELEKRFQDEEAAKLSDKERYEKQLAEQKATIDDLRVRADLKLAAADLGISLKLAQIILPKADLTFDDEGNATNVVALLKAAAEAHEIPLKSATNGTQQQSTQQPQQRVTSGGAVNPGRSTTNGSNNGLFDGDPQTVMARISHLSPGEYAARRQEITSFIAGNWNKLSGR